MDFAKVVLTDDQSRFAAEVNALLDAIVTDEVLKHERDTGDGYSPSVHLALGKKGWLMPDWPVSEGGAGLDHVETRILELELARRNVPHISAGTTRMSWVAVEKFANPEVLPSLREGVAKGTARFCLGYSEPDGGSDIAAAKVRAIRQGNHWLINGSKIFTTGAHVATHVFLITRTDPDLPKHKGLTMFLVPMDSPGIEVQAIHTFGGERTNVVYFGDVVVDDRWRLGDVNDGWAVLQGPLDEEHSTGAVSDGLDDISIGANYLRQLELALDGLSAWIATAIRPDGSALAEDPNVRQVLGRTVMLLEAAKCSPGAIGRVLGSETLVNSAADLMDLVGTEGLILRGGDGAIDDGVLEFIHRFAQGTATYGGTVEVFRTIIAQHDLGLPRPTYPDSTRSSADRK